MRKGLAIDVADMEVDGSVFRKKRGHILVPWVERLDELWLISGYFGCTWIVCLIIFLYADDVPRRFTGELRNG